MKDNVDFKQTKSNHLTAGDFCTKRRDFCTHSALGLFFAASPLSHAVSLSHKPSASSLLGFSPVSSSYLDEFIVAAGYIAKPLISWGDPLLKNAPAFDPSGTQEADVQAKQFGDNTDGMSLFPLANNRALLAVNNEYTNHRFLFSHDGSVLSAADVKKSQAAHGVSIFEINQNSAGHWFYLTDSAYNRRITANTEIELSGPVAGHPWVTTKSDPDGNKVLGTLNNCGCGQTPWGTYLTCEENFHKYFSSNSKIKRTPRQKRYGLQAKDKRNYQWYKHQSRFDLAKEPNEANRFGWVVEIDPFDPTSTPKKRTALGRLQHENAAVTIAKTGQVVVYMGDDQAGEHIYKFVSKNVYQADNPLANHDILDEGTLYVARFDAKPGQQSGKGQWLELTYGKNGLTNKNGFTDQAEVLIFARLAATIVGATTMDRPEWVAIHPDNSAVFTTLTRNKTRGVSKNQPLNGPNPRKSNRYGQIVRWWPKNKDHSNKVFSWDLFVLAGNPTIHHNNAYAGSKNITTQNMFNSPDGLGFDKSGRLWLLTDGKSSNSGDYSGMGNNQLLCADPNSGKILRFATGPIGCEIAGLAFSPDQRTLFVGVQHPGGKKFRSHFPAGGNTKPRSTIMMVNKIDGGIIGT
jgi:uncharacterized protein